MKFHVDRSLPIPLGVQLRGLIEYGVACGELAAGERLPSIRELADKIGVAPMTVSQVYRDAKQAGLIETRAGSGTFVADSSHYASVPRAGADLDHRIDALIDDALTAGLRPGDLIALFNARMFSRSSRPPRRRLAMVGIYQIATARYARFIAAHLGVGVTVDAITLDALKRDAALREDIGSADLVITFANRHREVEELVPAAAVVAISFIPSEETRLALASLSPLATIGIVSRVPEFLPIMKSGVRRFAPHVENHVATLLDGEAPETIIAGADVIVYATGAEAILDRLTPGTPAIEYRHIPDPVEIERVVAPLIRSREQNRSALQKEAS
jgi:DNA-binding transcriptional regulator YhcF (GntR family)